MNTEFLSATEVLQFGGAVTAITAITNTAAHFFPSMPTRVRSLIALALAFVIVGYSMATPLNLLLYLANSCLLFLATLGTNEVGRGATGGKMAPRDGPTPESAPDATGRSGTVFKPWL